MIKKIFIFIFLLISCSVIYFNLKGIHELGVITTYLSIFISPILMIGINAVSFLFDFNLDGFVWHNNSYSWWFVVIIIITGFLTWFKLCPASLRMIGKQIKKLRNRFFAS